MSQGESAIVVLSGGQDSTTCLWWAMAEFGGTNVAALTFDYGQRHAAEISSAKAVAEAAGVSLDVLPIDTFAALGGNSLTDAGIEVDSADQAGLPASFVPGRNLVFLTLAAAWAWQRGVQHIVTGVAQTDYSGYPDCRRETMNALEKTLALGMEKAFQIHTPLMHLNKKETVELACRLGAYEVLGLTHTCYEGTKPPCGKCQACTLRAKGFAEAGKPDPLLTP